MKRPDNSAQMAAESLPDIPIKIVDSRSVSLGLGFTVLAAAKAAAAGADIITVAHVARAMVGRVHVYFIVDTLEYLHRGGRIGGAAKLLGSALDLKPLLEIKDGIVKPLTRVRTRRKAMNKAYELLQEQFKGKDWSNLKDWTSLGHELLQVVDPQSLFFKWRRQRYELVGHCSPTADSRTVGRGGKDPLERSRF